MQNPGASVDYKWHAGLPLLSGLYLQGASSGFTVYDLFADDGVDFNTKLQNLVYNVSSRDITSVSEQIEVVNAGFRLGGPEGKDYISLGAYQETAVFSYWPRDLAILAFEGNAGHLNDRFNLGHLSFKGEVLTVFHAGINREVNKTLTLGIRGKIYNSILDFTSTGNKGRFFTILGENNIYRHVILADMELNTAGYASLKDIDAEGTSGISKEVLKRFTKKSILGGNLGLGVDLGFSYKPKDNVTISGSVLDLGFISYSKDVESYVFNGRYEFEGLDLTFPEVINGEGVNDYWDDFTDEIEQLYDTVNTRYTLMRPLKLNAGLKYEFGKEGSNECDCRNVSANYTNAVGLQLYAMDRPKDWEKALTLYYYRRIFSFLRAKASYTLDKYSETNFGLGISTHFANFNFYILADNLLEYQNLADARSASVQLGFNYIFPLKN